MQASERFCPPYISKTHTCPCTKLLVFTGISQQIHNPRPTPTHPNIYSSTVKKQHWYVKLHLVIADQLTIDLLLDWLGRNLFRLRPPAPRPVSPAHSGSSFSRGMRCVMCAYANPRLPDGRVAGWSRDPSVGSVRLPWV